MNVLLIDDHAMFRDALVLLFAHHLPEFKLLEADSISQAVEVAREHDDIALVLLDLGLTDSHGMASLDALRTALPELTVVVLSADARRRRFDVVVCWRLDRLGRNRKHLITLLEEWQALGVRSCMMMICLTRCRYGRIPVV